jgi:hypothetical protein
LAPTFDEENMLRKGSLSLFNLQGNRKHLSYAQHIVAEELVSEFKEGKGARKLKQQSSDKRCSVNDTATFAADRVAGLKE